MDTILKTLDFKDFWFILIPLVVTVLVKYFSDFILNRNLEKKLEDSKTKLYETYEILGKLDEKDESQKESPEELKIKHEIEKKAQVFKLQDFYNEQIKVYQNNTQNRASWSFIFAIIAMFFGLFFIILGSILVINKSNTGEIIALTSLSTIGGAISGFISKTFLDVHKTSLNQLNRYFKEPLINQYILKSQILSDDLDAKEKNAMVNKLFEVVTEIVSKNSDFT